MRSIKRNTIAALTFAAVAMVGLAGCSTGAADDTAAPAPEESSPSMEMDYTTDLVGAGCAAYAETVPDGSGSIVGMAQDPVAVAASNNPLLTTLTAAVSGGLNPDVNLVDTLNGSEFTVFAPVDDAFAALPAETVEALMQPENAELLTSILTYHVVPGQILPDDIAGELTTVNGEMVTVAGSGDSITVNGANVICGGVHTANATVYLIDGVLTPGA
ncbi:putative surface protein with fasciclin (FAS1) repeats [Salinibacterium amurskyense]|uniref:Putative surface protein with fasciclin (FAS1) repeats n=1 Tax=Salinibacterium amurskyense TaxID=205941 RepID=A0A2M9D889_9MICO|nr:fasciclin domain-containing protein [Salinibacterium amurskyense]PJJ81703.1 putative surface protein with fasciclin (FAS1) repeats [Salinibacterium amurskyense]RLQ83682.1 fasciclin domain-containing protein [Salinibacterium amurskyense]GHD79576.1 cell surface glycolipoprotein MPB83 [Salinibacterium amurskyense]